MKLRQLKEIANILASFTYAISMLMDTYLKIRFIKRNNHPDSPQGGK